MQFGIGLLTLEAANMVCGTVDDSAQFLRLVNVKLPGMDEQYLDHRPGGAPVAIEVDVQINKLRCDFTLAGWTPHVAELLDAYSAGQQMFWFYGALRDRITGNVVQAVAYMIGRLGVADMQAWQRGTINAWDYAIRGIIRYTLTVADLNSGGVETVYDWDFFTNEFATGQSISNLTGAVRGPA